MPWSICMVKVGQINNTIMNKQTLDICSLAPTYIVSCMSMCIKFDSPRAYIKNVHFFAEYFSLLYLTVFLLTHNSVTTLETLDWNDEKIFNI